MDTYNHESQHKWILKAVNKHNPPYVQELVKKLTHKYNLRANDKLILSHNNSIKGDTRSYHLFGTQVWNGLPNELCGTKLI